MFRISLNIKVLRYKCKKITGINTCNLKIFEISDTLLEKMKSFNGKQNIKIIPSKNNNADGKFVGCFRIIIIIIIIISKPTYIMVNFK